MMRLIIHHNSYLSLNFPVHYTSLSDDKGLTILSVEVQHRFFSWARTEEQLQDRSKCKKLAKYVSIEVRIDRTTGDGLVKLRAKRWTNR